MSTYTSDAWIESSHDPNIAFDDAGECPECGWHLDSGRCECPEFRCAKCDCAMQVERETGCCSKCDLEFDAAHQLIFGENLSAVVLPEPESLTRSTDRNRRVSGEARESTKPSDSLNRDDGNGAEQDSRGAQNLLSGSCENKTSEATRENAVHADCLAATTENIPATVRIRPAQNLSDIRDLQDKLGAEAAGLVWALKQLNLL